MQKMTKEEAKEQLKRHQSTVKVKTLDGEKEYNFVLLKRREAAEVFHNTLLVLAGALSEVVKSGDNTDFDLGKALQALDFSVLWDLATKLLSGAMVDGNELGELEESSYFEEQPEELYIAVWHAIQANYPRVFSKIRERLSGSSIAETMKTAFEPKSETA